MFNCMYINVTFDELYSSLEMLVNADLAKLNEIILNAMNIAQSRRRNLMTIHEAACNLV